MKEKPKITNKWKYTIDIKRILNNDTLTIEEKAKSILSEVKYIKYVTYRSNLTEDEIYFLDESLDLLIDNYNFFIDLCNGTINENEFNDYGFDGDFIKLFDEYLKELYDIADRRVLTKQNELEKFLWIG